MRLATAGFAVLLGPLASAPLEAGFAPTVAYPSGAKPHFVVSADLNGDGKPDLAVANFDDNDVSILLGNGDGTFQPALTRAVGTGPVSIAVGDFDRDGKLDLAVSNYLSPSQNVSILLGNGDGTFKAPVDYPVGTSPSSVTAGDFDRDGRLDLAVANLGSDAVSILLGNGDGTFQTAVDYATGGQPNSVAASDLDGDGKLDLVVADNVDGDVSVLLGNGDGTFQARSTFGAGTHPYALTVADLDRDGRQDLAVVNAGDAVNAIDGNVSILLGKGDGTFQTAVDYASGAVPDALAVADFDGDGVLDLAVGDFEFGPANVQVLTGVGDGTFQAAVTYAAGKYTRSLAVGDFDRDGRPDVAAANDGTDDVSVLLNNLSPLACTFPGSVDSAAGTLPYFLASGDFNRDGKPDLVVANWGSMNVSVLLGKGDGAFQAPGDYTVGSNPTFVAIGDFDRDGTQDLAVAHAGSSYFSILLGKGDGTFNAAVNHTAGTNPIALAVADLDRDGKPDLAIANFNSDNVSILLGKGDGTFQPSVEYGAGTQPRSLVVGDLDGDGRLDLAVANWGSMNVAVLLGNGDGTFGTAVEYGAGTNPFSIALGDFNRDGRLDLAVTNDMSNDVSVLLGNGDGTFQTAVDYAVGTNPSSVAVGHVNGSAYLAVTNAGFPSEISILQGQGDGTFGPQVTNTATVDPIYLAIGDFDRDGREDLAVADYNFSSNNVSTLSGSCRFVTVTAVVSSDNPSVFGQTVTFTAHVTSGSGGSGIPAGTVTFKDGTTTLGTGTLAAGAATLATSSLGVGTHSITAVYGGSTDFAPSTSPAVAQEVDRAPTTTAVVSSVDPSYCGQAVTFTATVSSAGGTPTGSVAFKDGATTLGSATLSSGVAALTTSAVAPGSRSITAVYGGDASFEGSTSPVLTQSVSVPSLSIDDVTVHERPPYWLPAAVFTVSLTGATSCTTSVAFATADGTAVAGRDYVSTSGVVSFASGRTSRRISVALLPRPWQAVDLTFFVNLSNPANATISDGQGLGTIKSPVRVQGSKPR